VAKKAWRKQQKTNKGEKKNPRKIKRSKRGTLLKEPIKAKKEGNPP